MLSITERIASLRETELFADLSEVDLKILAEVAEELEFTDGQTVFNEGEKGDAVYFISRGQVRIHKSGMELARRGRSECIGEMAVMDEGPRSTSVSSIGNSLLLRIRRDAFFQAVQGNVGLLQNIIRVVVRRFRKQMDQEIEAARENERLRHDLSRASELQMSMLPTQDLHITTSEGLFIVASGTCNPAETVGGDYYDYFPLPDERLGLVIGDVMGHGFHTGLMVSTAISCLHTQLRSDCCVDDVMRAMCDMVYGFVHGELYMSFCYIIVNLKDHTISFCNAGHPYPYHYRMSKGQMDVLESDTFPLGMFGNQEFGISKSEWEKGDVFALYTDGIIEAENQRMETFGAERLKQLIIKNKHLSPIELRQTVLHELDIFLQGATRGDDVTLVIVKMG